MRKTRYLIASLLCFAFAGLMGCAFFQANPIQRPVCWQTAILAATAADPHYETRIALWETPSGEKHAQAQALIDGEWRWLRVSPWTVVEVGDQEHRVIGEITYTEWLAFAVDRWMYYTRESVE